MRIYMMEPVEPSDEGGVARCSPSLDDFQLEAAPVGSSLFPLRMSLNSENCSDMLCNDLGAALCSERLLDTLRPNLKEPWVTVLPALVGEQKKRYGLMRVDRKIGVHQKASKFFDGRCIKPVVDRQAVVAAELSVFSIYAGFHVGIMVTDAVRQRVLSLGFDDIEFRPVASR